MDALHDWPWLGLGLAPLVGAWVVARGRAPRLRDPAVLVGLALPLYALHQVEEHGVDALGRHFAFLGELCRTLGFPTLDACPADAAFIFAVNPVAVWLAGALAIALGRRRPDVAAMVLGIPLVNAGAHLGPAIVHGAYNPGLVTALALFVPYVAWTLRTLVRAGVLAVRQVPLVVVAGALVHGVLLASLEAKAHGLIGVTALLAVNAANGLSPTLLGLAVLRRAPAPR